MAENIIVAIVVLGAGIIVFGRFYRSARAAWKLTKEQKSDCSTGCGGCASGASKSAIS